MTGKVLLQRRFGLRVTRKGRLPRSLLLDRRFGLLARALSSICLRLRIAKNLYLGMLHSGRYEFRGTYDRKDDM